MKMKMRVVVPAVCLAMVLSFGCSKKEEGAPGAPQSQTQRQAMPAFSATLPSALAGKTMSKGGKVFVDGLNKQSDAAVNVRNEDGFDINGWAYDDKTKTAPDTAIIELAPIKGGDKYYAAAKRSEREDLAKAFNNPALKNAAYYLKADINSVPPGEYMINIIQIVDGNAITAPTGKKINKTN